MCKEPLCRTNDNKSPVYCPECLIINFPSLDIEDIFNMYINTIKGIEQAAQHKSGRKFFEELTPGEMKEEAFDFYNHLMLIKERKRGLDE